MTSSPTAAPRDDRAAVVLGARNLGGAVARHLSASGWRVAAVARSEDSLGGLEDDVVRIRGDAAEPDELEEALSTASERLGRLDLIVNAVSAARPPRSDGAFGGGPIAEAEIEDFDGWTAAVARQGFVFLSRGARALRTGGRGGTLVQVTGGSSRRGMPQRGLWAAGAFGLRAMTQAAAAELRPEGIHVALLAIDGIIESPKTAAMTEGMRAEALIDPALVGEAVEYLAGQGVRAFSHQLTLTPSAETWVP